MRANLESKKEGLSTLRDAYYYVINENISDIIWGCFMEKVDFSPLQAIVNEMALKIAIILVVPFMIGLIVKFALVKLRVLNYPAI